jgi:hypothetical protein
MMIWKKRDLPSIRCVHNHNYKILFHLKLLGKIKPKGKFDYFYFIFLVYILLFITGFKYKIQETSLTNSSISIKLIY